MRAVRWGGLAALCVAAGFVLVSAGPSVSAPTCTTTFNKASGQWATATNWTAGIPTATSYACVPVGSTATLAVTGVADGVRIDGTLQGAGTLTVTDAGTVSDSELNGTLTNVKVTMAAGTLVVNQGSMSGTGTTTVASGASMRVTDAGGSYGLFMSDSRSIVNNGTVSLEQSADTGLPAVFLNGPDTALRNNATLDLKNGSDVVGSGVLRVPATGLVRSSTAGTQSSVDVTVELAGQLDPTAGTLRVGTLTPAAGGSTTGVVRASGGALELATVTVPAGSTISSEGTGVLLNGQLNGDGQFVVSSGTLRVLQVGMSNAGTTTVASGATLRVTDTGGSYGLFVSDSRSIVNNGTVSLEQSADTGLPSVFLNGPGVGLVNNATVLLKNGADIVGTGTVTNNATGTVTKPDTATSTSGLSATVDNFGTLRSESGLIDVTGAFPAITGPALNRGTYEMIAPGKIKLPADITNNKATILLDGAAAQLQDTGASGTVVNGLGNLSTNSGSLTIRNGKSQSVATLTQSGTVVVGAGSTLVAPTYTQSAGTTSLTAADSRLQTTGAANINGGTLRGIGTVQTGPAGLTVNAGRLEPGLSGPGTLSVTGKVTLGASSTLDVDVTGTGAGQADRVVATGAMAVGGKIDLHTSYTPALGDTTEILTGSSRTGSFTSATGGDLPGDISWGATYNPTNVVLRASRPSATIGDVTVTEGNAGTKAMTFTVTQTESLLTASSVSAQSADGTAVVAGPAVGGTDYEASSGTVTIPFGATTATFSVPVKGDEIYEHDDALTVGLTSPDNLTLADASATGTISNDEATPRLVAGSLGVVEKDTGATTNGNVPVSLTPVSAFPTTVDWATAPGTASASDYNAAGGTLTFAPGVPSRNAVVPIVGDFTTEDDETVQVNLSNPTAAGDAILGESGVLTIRDDDAAVSVSDVTVDEPVSGTVTLTFTATLSHVNPRIVGFNWATSDGTAVAPGDYLAGSGSSTIAVGQLTRNFTVTVNADTLSEGDENFFTILSAITGGQPGRTNATMTIKDNRCTILGTAGNDDLWGTTGNDVICGLGGNDTIHPGPGDDEVYGGSGSPTAPEAGKDTIDYSQYKVTPDAAPTATGCDVTADLYKAEGGGAGTCVGTDQIWNMENITGTEFNDTLRGNAKANTLQGNGGNDMLLGDAGDDILVGGADNACSTATVFCGDAVSYVRFVDATGVAHEAPDFPAPSVTVTLAKTIKQNTGGAGSDTIQGVESLFGTNSNDTLTGNNFASTISGLAGDDVIHGAAGNDTLFGNEGRDVVHGDAAVDRVFGGDGDDIVNGDAGVDLAVDGEAGDDIVFGGDGDESKGGRIRGGDGLHDFCHDGDVGSPVFAYEGSGCENS